MKTEKKDFLNMLDTLPAQDGFYMPAEFTPQDGVLLVWPVRPGSWGKDPAAAQRAFCDIMREAAKSERVYLLADSAHLAEARAQAGAFATVFEINTDDAWARDIGPTFVTNGSEVRGISWRFNAWGGSVDGLYEEYANDDAAAEAFCSAINADCYDAGDFVLEGGSICSDGEGTLLVTEACLLSAGRNPHLNKARIEQKLKDYLGVQKILWLPRGIYNDETNEHVDNVCAFIRPGEVVLAWTDDEHDPQYALSRTDYDYLSQEIDARGRKLTIHKLPIPDYPVCVTESDMANYVFEPGEDARQAGDRLAASYVNFYYTNDAILLPQFGGENASSDARAAELMRALCPERRIVPISSREILLGGGNIHCVTQQIPKNVIKYEKRFHRMIEFLKGVFR
ncbi:MAG TPA: agmatine deiminase [Clostridiales bacterium]|nr:agmatine deiminase [Clostridiales bacterium]